MSILIAYLTEVPYCMSLGSALGRLTKAKGVALECDQDRYPRVSRGTFL